LIEVTSNTEIAELRRELSKFERRLIIWIIGAWFAVVLALTGVVWTATQVLLYAHP
jgi:hypothetical protein